MSINSMPKKLVSSSLILAICGHMAASMPIAVMVYASQAAFASSAVAAPQTKRNAQGLLSDMRVSFGMIAKSYKDDASARHRSAASVLEAVTHAAQAAQQLETALANHNGKAIAGTTGGLSRAIGELQTRYALTLSQNKQAAQGMRYLNAAWKTYSSRYVLSKPANDSKTVSKDEVRALRKKVTALKERVTSLEGQVATNAALRREVVRLRQDLAYYDSRPDDYWTYQSMLLTLTVVSGSFDALTYTTRVYYPTYYVYFEPVSPDFHIWRSYWDGYYDGYYDGRNSVWYDDAVVIDGPLVEITQIEINQEITYQTIYNMADETRLEYEALPQEILTDTDIPAAPEDTIFTTQTLTQPEYDDAIRQTEEVEPVSIENSSESSDVDKVTEPAIDSTTATTSPQDNEQEIISNSDGGEIRDTSSELSEKIDPRSEETQGDSGEISASEQDQQQEIIPNSGQDEVRDTSDELSEQSYPQPDEAMNHSGEISAPEQDQ